MAALGVGGGGSLDTGVRGSGAEDKDAGLHLGERKRIRLAFDLFDRDRRKVVPKEEIGTIMRYLGAYPSEEELTNDILPSLADDDEAAPSPSASSTGAAAVNAAAGGGAAASAGGGGGGTGVVRLERFEPLMLRVLLERLYEPDSEELILQAFRVLDPENRGYIDEHTMHELLTENEWAFRDKEIEDFMRVAKDPDTNYIHYEDYVSMLSS
jgi:Ca2+-binding EF-hand superfamily protein